MLENATDYSVMNTGKQMLWLPTSRGEKYQAKQAIDGFFVRLGDLVSAGLVFVFTAWLALGPIGVASGKRRPHRPVDRRRRLDRAPVPRPRRGAVRRGRGLKRP